MTTNLVVQTSQVALIKKEKDDDYSDDINEDSLTLPDNTDEDAAPQSTTQPPLRKSSRTSVLNRKPFVKPKKQKQTKQKPAALKSKKQTPAAKLVGAKKRKQGGVMKILNTSGGDKKKTLALISAEGGVKRPRKGDAPRSTRRAAVFATNMYERTAEGLFRCKECGKEAKLQTNIRKHLRKHTGWSAVLFCWFKICFGFVCVCLCLNLDFSEHDMVSFTCGEKQKSHCTGEC